MNNAVLQEILQAENVNQLEEARFKQSLYEMVIVWEKGRMLQLG
jgi:hypothetical protein